MIPFIITSFPTVNSVGVITIVAIIFLLIKRDYLFKNISICLRKYQKRYLKIYINIKNYFLKNIKYDILPQKKVLAQFSVFNFGLEFDFKLKIT